VFQRQPSPIEEAAAKPMSAQKSPTCNSFFYPALSRRNRKRSLNSVQIPTEENVKTTMHLFGAHKILAKKNASRSWRF
jgi:hypothetical protein